MSNITLEDIKKNTDATEMITAANRTLEVLGYTEHGLRHVGYVSRIAADILRSLGYDQRTVELTEMTGYLHDVGNLVNRVNHGITGATLVMPLLTRMGMPMSEVVQITTAIGNHEEQVGKPVSAIGAAIIIADKVDAHRSRVRKGKYDRNDIHDRVNYSIKNNKVTVDKQNMIIRNELTMDESSCVLDYFHIYFARMRFCEDAAAFLGCKFQLYINGVLLNLGA